MRIRLIVRRHSLPPAHVLWTVGGTTPPYTSGAVGVTISQLLEQINDVIPLESADWGLEDYSVEVEGFECLHFSELSQVLKEDDEVCIRPLQTSDLRFRRRSGRHQITADGKHIIDGVAFGRPFLRRAERPAIKIPPRKRRRVMYDELEDDTEEEIYNDRQVTIRAGFDNTDLVTTDSEDEEGDEDFVEPGQEEEDLTAELRDIHQESATSPLDVSARSRPRRSTRGQAHLEGLGLQGAELLELRDDNGRAYPSDYNNPLLELYSEEKSQLTGSNTKKRKRKSHDSLENLNKSFELKEGGSSVTPAANRRESNSSSKSVRFEDDAPATPPTTILAPEDSDDTEDEEFEPPAEADEETDESDKENAAPKVEEDVSSEVMSSESDSSSSSSESEDDSDDTSSSGSSTSSSDAETEIEEPSGSSKTVVGDVDSSSSSGSSSSSSATSSNQRSQGKGITTRSKFTQGSGSTSEHPMGSSDSKVERHGLTLNERQYSKIRKMKEPDRARGWLKCVLVDDPKSHVEQFVLYQAYKAQFQEDCAVWNDLVSAETLIRTVPDLFAGARAECLSCVPQKYVITGIRPPKFVTPGQGKTSTRVRNQRRRKAVASKRRETISEQPNEEAPTIATAEHERAEAASKTPDPGMGLEASVSHSADPQFEARRQALLDAIASGGVDLGTEPSEEEPATGGLISSTESIDVSAGSKAPLLAMPGKTDSSGKPLTDFVQSLPFNGEGPDTAMKEETSTAGQPPVREIREPVEPTVAQAPTEKAQGESSKPRSKIDLASSRRLLFGALGLRTPKSKADEKALQAKLMKDVKPVKPTQSIDESSHEKTEPAKDDDQDWRGKIDLRAVECCYDGIELSTPPFPFVQRWDPQQKRGYKNVEGKQKNGKRNKRKRHSEQYYDDGWEEQALMPARKRGKSATPELNYDEVYPNDDDDEKTQTVVETARQPANPPSSNDLNQGAVSEQLLRESQEAVANAVAEDSFQEDLPLLPEDLTGCPDLTIENAKPGTIVAFKKLDMSVETNWQPRVSEYRTAIVDERRDDGTLYMTLAFRDRPDQEAAYDLETGERLYHKFEMPGYDNDDEDGSEGHIELPLAELIEPKIVRNAESKDDGTAVAATEEEVDDGASGGQPAAADEIEVQGDDDASKLDETWEGFEESTRLSQSAISDQVEEQEKAYQGVETKAVMQTDGVEEADPVELLPEAKPYGDAQEAVESTVGGSDDVRYPDLGGKLDQPIKLRDGDASTYLPQPKAALGTTDDQLRQEISTLIKDAGWRSSIHVQGHEPSGFSQEPQHPHQEEVEVNVQSSNPPSPRFHGFDRSSIADASETLPAEIPETYQEPLEVEDSLLINPLDHMEDPRGADDSMVPLDNDDESQLWDAQTSGQIAPIQHSPSISPPLMSTTFESGSENKKALRNRPSVSRAQTTKAKSNAPSNNSQDRPSISPPRVSKSRTKARNSGPQAKTGFQNPFSTNGTNSEEDLPSLGKVFASRISSLQPVSSQSSTNLTIKPEDSQVDMQKLPRHKSSRKSTSSQPVRSTKSSSIPSQLPFLPSDDDQDFVPSSQVPQGTQIVDLTLSSDPVEPSDSAYEGDSSLPNGPGWMSKLRSSQRARSVGKEGERRS